MNVQSALDVLKKLDVIDQYDSRIAAVVRIRESEFDSSFVENVLTDLCRDEFKTEMTAFDAEFNVKEPANVKREREIFNKYLLSYLVTELIKSRSAGALSFKQAYESAVDQAIKMTTDRLYGDLTWIDAGVDAIDQSSSADAANGPKQKISKSPQQKNATRVAKPAVVKTETPKSTRGTGTPPSPKAGGRVAMIFDHVLSLYRDQKIPKKDVIANLMTTFTINKEVTAVTYFNDCLKLHSVPRRAE